MFAFVHSLHHRNTDIEPFAGLCMHPVEHLYYYSCILPSVFLFASPFHFLWNGIHLLFSPAAGHSGWEDHMQVDDHDRMVVVATVVGMIVGAEYEVGVVVSRM